MALDLEKAAPADFVGDGAPALEGEIVTRTALEAVARGLYEAMERLDPGPEDFIDWDGLPGREREFYALVVRRLLCLKQQWLELFADYDDVTGHIPERE